MERRYLVVEIWGNSYENYTGYELWRTEEEAEQYGRSLDTYYEVVELEVRTYNQECSNQQEDGL